MPRTISEKREQEINILTKDAHYGLITTHILRLALSDTAKELKAERAAHQELIDACTALFDAPHQEHFAVRLNDEEMAALDRIKFILER